MNKQIQKSIDTSVNPLKEGTKLRSTASKFQQRVVEASIDPLMLPDRIVLALDCSGSMCGDKIESLKRAVVNFVRQCSPTKTALGLLTFGRSTEDAVPLTTTYQIIEAVVNTASAQGGTPLYGCIDRIIRTSPVTRVVLVSDGCPTDRGSEHSIVTSYKESGIPIDCVHIGDDSSGEDVLRWISTETGGIFLKFTDIHALTTGLSYLTPGLRGLLQSGTVDSKTIGAKEIK